MSSSPLNICPSLSRKHCLTNDLWMGLLWSRQLSSKGTGMMTQLEESDLQGSLTKLWESDQVPTAHALTTAEQSAVYQFQTNLFVNPEDNHYASGLPWIENPAELGQTQQMAKLCLISNKRKMKWMGKLESFQSEVRQYLELSHAEIIPQSELNHTGYYMPMHGIIKEELTTTKIRPVCDCSATSSSGYLFNDCLLPGPSLYPAITDILLVFRQSNIHVALMADVPRDPPAHQGKGFSPFLGSRSVRRHHPLSNDPSSIRRQVFSRCRDSCHPPPCREIQAAVSRCSSLCTEIVLR